MDKYIGKRLDGRYELRELVGVGGMANVYKAFDLAENRWVAVKVLREEYMDNEEFLRRFRNESRAVATLSHPNIVRVYDVSFSQKLNSIVMEYIDGITLKEYIDQQTGMAWKETVHFTVQILRALQHAHDNGIVHRDIKPQNIMLLSDGTIKVTDFGIARFARSNTKTITDRAIGSVHYISPEQAQGGVIDEKTDIYSVGVMMYEMLTGKLPFDAESPVSVALLQIQKEPERPTSINPEIPEGLEAITMRAMQKDPARRYQSAAEMLRDIDEFKHNPSISFAYKYLNEPPRQSAHPPEDRNQQTRMHTRVNPSAPAVPPPQDDEDEDPPRVPFLSVLTGITVAFVLVSGIFVGTMFYYNNPMKPVDVIQVPKLIGEKYTTVKYDSELIEKNIQIYQEPAFNDKYDNDVIYEQDPKPGQEIKVGGTIRVKVSAGQKMMTLRDLTEMETNEAIAVLTDKGIKIENIDEVSVYSDTVPEGSVVSTEPEANTQIDGSTKITIYTSLGRENKMVKIPNLTGMQVDDAKRLLKNFQIRITKATPVESDAAIGVIVGQSPAADTEMTQGGSMEVEISGGEDGGDAVRLRIPVTLPTLRQPVQVRAKIDGKVVYDEELSPGVAAGDTDFSRIYEGSGVKELRIVINDMIYQTFKVDFDQKKHALVDDYSGAYQNGVPKPVEEGGAQGSVSSDDEDAYAVDEPEE